MSQNSIRLFSVFGIPIRIHTSWLIIFILVTWSLALGYFPVQYEWPTHLYWIVGVITSLLFFCSVLLHELAHSMMAIARGMTVKDIVLFVFGGVSEIGEEPPSASTEFLMSLVGPLTSFAIAAAAYVLWRLTYALSEPVSAVGLYLARINVLLGVFNLIPGFPLDGGRVLRSILWGATRDLQKATRWAVRMGQLVSYLFILLGVWLFFVPGGWFAGLWMIFIGWFLNNAARTSQTRSIIKHALMGYTVRQVMNVQCERISPDMSVETLVNEYLLKRGTRCLPVTENGRLLGLVTVHAIKSIPSEEWKTTPVVRVMVPLDQMKAIEPDQELWNAFEQMTEEGVNQLPVMEQGRLIGLVARDTLMGFLRTKAELGV